MGASWGRFGGGKRQKMSCKSEVGDILRHLDGKLKDEIDVRAILRQRKAKTFRNLRKTYAFDGFKTIKKGFEGGERRPKMAPKRAQDGPKMGEDAGKTASWS